MIERRIKTLACIAGACLVLAACVKSGSTPAVVIYPNISGDYSGTMQDSVLGAGSVSGTLAQHGNAAGGTLADVTGATTTNLAMSLSVSATKAVSGTFETFDTSGSLCTFSTTGTYANNGSSSATITGTYTAITNCSGEAGSYTLNQQCTNTATSIERRRSGFPPAC